MAKLGKYARKPKAATAPKKAAKKAAARKAPKVAARPAASKRSRAVSPASSRRSTGPRSQALPGLEQVRNGRLDNLCESIAQTRSEMNKLRLDDASDSQGALKEMRRASLTSYRHAGVELARVPGEEKLRIRTSRETATAETAEEPELEVEPSLEDGEFGEERAAAVEEIH